MGEELGLIIKIVEDPGGAGGQAAETPAPPRRQDMGGGSVESASKRQSQERQRAGPAEIERWKPAEAKRRTRAHKAGAAASAARAARMRKAGRAAGGTRMGMGRTAAAASRAAGIAGAVVEGIVAGIRAVAKEAQNKFARGADVATKVARNDGLGAAVSVAEGGADLADKIPLVGGMVSGVVRAGTGLVKAVDQVAGALVERARTLAKFSAPVAAAEARANLRQVQADIREAREVGPAYAKLIDVYSKFTAEMQEALAPLKKFMAEKLAKFFEYLTERADQIAALVEKTLVVITSLTEALLKWILDGWQAAKETINGMYKQLDEINRRERRREDKAAAEDNVLDDFLRDFRFAVDQAGAADKFDPDWARAAARNPVNMPAFGGI